MTDLHMNALAAHQVIDHAQALDADLILQVGDFGFWPRSNSNAGQKYLRKVDARLAAVGLNLWFVPGNHEDWPALARRPIGEDGLRLISDQIREIPLGHRWRWGTTDWVGIGGAPSVDKHLCTEGLDWFPEEEVTE
nr:metallophosphoesterase family protein [Propionicimonas sp.]